MPVDKREILQAVREGAISPEEAVVRLEELDRDRTPEPGAATARPDTRVRVVRIVGDLRSARIVGDAAVTEAVAEGPHTARRDGDVLHINADIGASLDEGVDFRFHRHPTPRPRVWIGIGSGGVRPRPLEVRMNPDLALEVRIDAGSASIKGVRGPIKGEIDAGTIKIQDIASPFDLAVDAGAVSIEGLLDRGESKIRCDAGSVKVLLRKGSSVRVRARADVGTVRLGRQHTGVKIGREIREAVFGEGAATLDITGGIGRVVVEEQE